MKKLIRILLVLCFVIGAAQTVANFAVVSAYDGEYLNIFINLPLLYIGGKLDYSDISGTATDTEADSVEFDLTNDSSIEIVEYYWMLNNKKVTDGTAFTAGVDYKVHVVLHFKDRKYHGQPSYFELSSSNKMAKNITIGKYGNYSMDDYVVVEGTYTMRAVDITFTGDGVTRAYKGNSTITTTYPGDSFMIEAENVYRGKLFCCWDISRRGIQITNINDTSTLVKIPIDFDYNETYFSLNYESVLGFESVTPETSSELGKICVGTPEATVTASFVPKELPKVLKDLGYTIETSIYFLKDDLQKDTVVKSTSSTSLTYTVSNVTSTLTNPYDAYRIYMEIFLYDPSGEKIERCYEVRYFLVYKYEQLEGSIYYTSGVCINKPITVSLSEELAADQYLKYQWQKLNKEYVWVNIVGANSATFTPPTTYLGQTIRLQITSGRKNGNVVSHGKIVNKQTNGNMPAKPVLSVSGQTIKIENYSEDQEYMIYGSGYKLTEWNEATEFEGNTVDAGAYASFYIYTRYKETATTQAGYHIASQWITVKDPSIVETYARGYSYPDGNKLYIAIGESAEINYALSPTNANTAIPDLKPTDSSILLISQQKSVNKLLVKGLKAGTVVINPYNAGTTTRWETSYNTASYITVVVYDPNDMQYAHFTADAPYGDIALEVGDTYTPESTDEVDVVFTPESAKNVFTNYRWYVINKSNMFGTPTIGTTSEDGSVTVDPVTGKLTALKAGKATLYLYALKTGDYTATAPTSNATPYYIKQVTVTVTDPSLPPFEGVSISQTEADVVLGNKLYLEACPAPINSAENYTVSWSTTNNLIATVADGVVTTKGYGTVTITAKITVNGVTKSASCVVNVVEATELGDTNVDGYVDNLDALMILKYDAGIIELEYEQEIVSDVNCDGYIDNLDALMILKYDAGIIDSLK